MNRSYESAIWRVPVIGRHRTDATLLYRSRRQEYLPNIVSIAVGQVNEYRIGPFPVIHLNYTTCSYITVKVKARVKPEYMNYYSSDPISDTVNVEH